MTQDKGGLVTPLGQMLRLYRASRSIDMRELAREIGISAATLCRLEASKDVAFSTAVSILQWMCAKRNA